MSEHPRPESGGSYRRDPDTGALTLVEATRPAQEPPAAEAKAAPAAAPKPTQGA